ncbi:hypothetical protein BQ8794_410002 [Mesorhizobium prunaredense]|uniref:Uncharacterized protein n=1 Tax=Mesorhizobium prunaredense TaxID=1631249 RepID=A0A1R3VHE2_9HYPH|nr:hypothetical protein BQ8794_410002 [Mesorhizobium prunaredense]
MRFAQRSLQRSLLSGHERAFDLVRRNDWTWRYLLVLAEEPEWQHSIIPFAVFQLRAPYDALFPRNGSLFETQAPSSGRHIPAAIGLPP